MIYVFDTSPLVSLSKNYYRSRFPTLWGLFEANVANDEVISTREVSREIEDRDDELLEWAKAHHEMFATPNAAEGAFVAQIYGVPHFQANIERQKILNGGKNADPFVIAKAFAMGGAVVTLEKDTPNAARIPNICKHFEIPCMNLEEFMIAENWQF